MTDVSGLGLTLHFALLGAPQALNAWSLFDEPGAAYADRALHAGEYPSLYHLSVPAREFEAYIAAGLPSAINREGDFYTGTVKLQTGLRWSDGSPLTAADAAFTANTALAFGLGEDWSSAYDPAVLQRAEALDEWTVRFTFKRAPTVADWQYGLLQGPIVSQGYWSPKLGEAVALLPPAEVLDALDKAQAEADELQKRIAEDQAQLLTTVPGTPGYAELSTRIKRNQDDLIAADNKITRLQDERDAALTAAREVLFGLSASGEPAFGPYLRAVKSGSLYTRQADTSYPFAKPNFGRVSYAFFSGAQAAGEALTKGDVDAILAPGGLPPELVSQALSSQPSLTLLRIPSSSARFLALNPSNPVLSDPALRQALSCALDRLALAGALQAQPLEGFVLPGIWKNPQAALSCAYAPGDAAAVALLRGAGYRWTREPAADQPGEGLMLPDGAPLPEMTLLAPDQDSDPQRAEAARLVVQYLRALGIPLSAQYLTPEDLRYAVYSSGRYDIALLGWRLSEYPAYLCEWFQPPGAFAYPEAALQSACDQLKSTADLGTARAALSEIQSILMQDLPLIPLYRVVEFELVRNASWPWDQLTGGLSGLYGAPELAIPAP